MSKIVKKNIKSNNREFELGAYLGDLEDSSDLSLTLLKTHSRCFEFQDMEMAQTLESGYSISESQLSTTEPHKIQATSIVYEGNTDTSNTHWEYTVLKTGFYVVHTDIFIEVSAVNQSDLDNFLTEPLTVNLYKNNEKFSISASKFPVRVYNIDTTDIYYILKIPLHGSWGVKLNAGDKIDLRVNLYNKTTPSAVNINITARVLVTNYGISQDITEIK